MDVVVVQRLAQGVSYKIGHAVMVIFFGHASHDHDHDQKNDHLRIFFISCKIGHAAAWSCTLVIQYVSCF